ncbi:Hypothetical protein D9617_8g050130 [Elsinoe fawcettii]|nr:Hypothetical protein D9617_8g050130 [Elsinoe fawcettii]
MSLLFLTITILVSLLTNKVQAKGYDESGNLGLEQNVGHQSVQFSFGGFLQLNGLVFGKTGKPDVTFASWSARQRCRLNGGTAVVNGYPCVESLIYDATYKAAEGTRAGAPNRGNLVNVIGVKPGNTRPISLYTYDELGQGSSCTSPATYKPMPEAPCPGTEMDENSLQGNLYTFDSRGIKVTCKAACGQVDAINRDNWRGLMAQLSQYMRDNDWFAARFAVKRISNNSVLARCRITAPYLISFPMTNCPDRVPSSGITINNADSVPG